MIRKDQIRNLEIPGSMLAHRPGMTACDYSTGKSPIPCQAPPAKIFCFSEMANHPICILVPSHRGALRNVNNAERDAMDAAVLARDVMAGRIGERSVSR
jgi:hypothetical protein